MVSEVILKIFDYLPPMSVFSDFYLCIMEYQIKETVIPSFLNYTFFNLPEEQFPSDITLSMSLSRITGTLLNSVDNKHNQLIVSLNDANTPTEDIEINNQRIYIFLFLVYPRKAYLDIAKQEYENILESNSGVLNFQYSADYNEYITLATRHILQSMDNLIIISYMFRTSVDKGRFEF